ncbi:universal stress protein [Maribacter sp. ACAM166]|uniref:universal stress protein n=1 Tax=Maribacter sp. ACAM166 TaxID=2508996 RepID=UPI0010FDBF00|nr:universal stress protein [Maribacter sp. ACAM166]TLP81808.1 universal stress protein [Maribacter sp. ACAM166]
MKRILLPTDFSDNSFEAIRYALLVLKDVTCTFYLLHTYNPPVYEPEYVLGSPGQIGLGDIFQESSLRQLEKLQKRLENQYHNPNHKFMVHTAMNSILNEVLETIEAEKIDLVVMGTKGATGAKEILFGTNAVHVIKKSKCPVIVVPPNFEYIAPKEILFPTDFEIEYEEEKFKQLLDITKVQGSRVHIMHVSTGFDLTEEQEKNKKQVKKIFGKNCLLHDVPDNAIIAAVNNCQTKEKIHLLVMVQNKHTFFERLFIEPVIKKIGFHIQIPFMVLPQL